MRVFILCTGRSGSVTFIKACKHIKNFTCGHETRADVIGPARIDYPDQHIEADNRLSWMLGALDAKFGTEPYFVHLVRDREEVAQSFNRRWRVRRSIIKAFTVGIRMQKLRKLDDQSKLQLSYDYVDTVHSNIEHFLKDKPRKMTIELSNVEQGFEQLVSEIGADCNMKKAFKVLKKVHNPSKERNLIKRVFS